MERIELLAPAGSMETLIAAVNGGANAIYLGGKSFGARRSAQNFTNEEISEAIQYCHQRNVSVYATVNTLVKDDEIQDAVDFVEFLYKNDIDAVIIQDIGLLNVIKKQFPDLHCHASTQMTFHDLTGVKYAKSMGFHRVVLSRELSFVEIKEIAENVDIEIEFFVHGALCISYSGQCLMSSYIGGRSGNRGACAQPCRKKYKIVNHTSGRETESSYLMSPKDLMTYAQIEQLRAIKNVSLKIEGRMKGADYVFSIVNSYRNGIDKGFESDKVVNFSRTFNRQFTSGFMFDDDYTKMMNYELPSSYGTPVATVVKLENEKLELRLLETLNKGDEIQFRSHGETVGTRTDVIMLKHVRVAQAQKGELVTVPFKYQVPQNAVLYKTYDKEYIDEMVKKSQMQRAIHSVSFEFVAHLGEKAKLIARFNQDTENTYAFESVALVELAQKKALDEARVIEQLSKVGGTPFYVTTLKCTIDANATVPISEINQMRRQCLEAYLQALTVRYASRNKLTGSRKLLGMISGKPSARFNSNVNYKFNLVFNQVKDLLAALSADTKTKDSTRNFKLVYYLSDINGYSENLERLKSENVIPLLPRIIRSEESEQVRKFLSAYASADTERKLCISHIGQMELVKELPLILEADYSVNALNSESGKALESININQITWSTELSKDELKRLDFASENNGVFVYGHLPLMISEYCPVGGVYVGHDHCGLCENNRFSLIDDRNATYPLVCDPKDCRIEVMSSVPVSLLDHVPMLMKNGLNVFRMSLDSFDENAQEIIEKINALSNINDIDICFPYNPEANSRGNFNRGIE